MPRKEREISTHTSSLDILPVKEVSRSLHGKYADMKTGKTDMSTNIDCENSRVQLIHWNHESDNGAPVYLAAVMQYLTERVLTAAASKAKASSSSSSSSSSCLPSTSPSYPSNSPSKNPSGRVASLITPDHIAEAIAGDETLTNMIAALEERNAAASSSPSSQADDSPDNNSGITNGIASNENLCMASDSPSLLVSREGKSKRHKSGDASAPSTDETEVSKMAENSDYGSRDLFGGSVETVSKQSSASNETHTQSGYKYNVHQERDKNSLQGEGSQEIPNTDDAVPARVLELKMDQDVISAIVWN